MKNNAPAGIRLLPDPAFPLSTSTLPVDPTLPLVYNRIIPIEAAPDYKDGLVTITPPIGLPFATLAPLVYPVPNLNGSSGYYPYPGIHPSGGTVLMVEESVVSITTVNNVPVATPNVPTSWFWNVRVGDKIRVNSAGPWYTVVGPMLMTPTSGNVEMFVNVGPPGTVSPLRRTPAGAIVNPEFLFVVNGFDDNGDGWTDAGWDGVDNDGNGIVDDLPEWMLGNGGEQEGWLSPNMQGVFNVPYVIQRRPAPSANAREIALPSNVVIDATTWAGTQERSRLPVNRFTGFVDILVTPTGAVVPSYIYSTPTSFSMSSSFYHFWLAERSDVQPPDPSATSAPCLPLPATVASVYPGGGSIKGEYRLVTLFSADGPRQHHRGAALRFGGEYRDRDIQRQRAVHRHPTGRANAMTTATITPRQTAGLKDALRSLRKLTRQVVSHDLEEPTDDTGDDWRAWDETLTLLVEQEQDARARLVKLLCTVATPPFALIVGDELIGLAARALRRRWDGFRVQSAGVIDHSQRRGFGAEMVPTVQ